MLAYTEDILEYQGCATTVLVTSAGMGEMVMQVLVGSVIHSEGSYSFLLCGMIIGCIGFILFLVCCFSTECTRTTSQVHRKRQPWWRNRSQTV
uniref:Uncharacterized protein n=1 Tax=Anguilla anguilla TaxID=7936 RepID=A0A0E9WU33_ANGAN